MRDITARARGIEHAQEIIDAVKAVPGVKVVNVSDRTFLMHLGGKIEVQQQDPGQDPERPLHGVHPRRRARLHGDPQGHEEVVLPHHPAELRRRRLRRDGGPGAGRHRPRGGDAGHGREGDALQGVRRDRRLADLPQHEGSRRDRPDRQGARADLRGDQPRGHLRAALLRDRGAPEGRDGDPRVPRRPARDGGGRPRRAAELPEDREEADRGPEDRGGGRGRRRGSRAARSS